MLGPVGRHTRVLIPECFGEAVDGKGLKRLLLIRVAGAEANAGDDNPTHQFRMREGEPQRDLAAIAESDQIRIPDSLLNEKSG